MHGFPDRLTYQLTHLDGEPLPAPYADPTGRYSLNSGYLTLEPDGQISLVLDQVPHPDMPDSRAFESTLVESYRRTANDGFEFPSGQEGDVPEFFGTRIGRELVVIARPLLRSDFSVAREYGGVHEWRFVQGENR